MTKFNEKELEIILALYLFDYSKIGPKLLKDFTDKFNIYFNKDESPQSINYALSIFKNIDPKNVSSAFNSEKNEYHYIWKHFVDDDNAKKLKELYTLFKKKNMNFNSFMILDENSYTKSVNEKIIEKIVNPVIDKPKPLYSSKNDPILDGKSKRDITVALRALKIANYQCEFNPEHETFLRKNIDLNYTEGHHLIPLEFQYKFSVNLDVEANVVSLCSNCHNQIHYGKDAKVLIRKLYSMRKNRLQECGINITLEELLAIYN